MPLTHVPGRCPATRLNNMQWQRPHQIKQLATKENPEFMRR